MAQTTVRIVIVGGGVSGLSTACSLVQNCSPNVKLDIKILEASSRLGGRVRTVPIPDDPENGCVSLGASFVHGHENNPVYDILSKNNIKMAKAGAGTNPPSGHTQMWDSSGKMIPQKDSEQFTAEIDKICEEVYESLPVPPDSATTEEEASWKRQDQSLETLIEKKVSEKLGSALVDSKNNSHPSEIYRLYKWRIGCYYGSEMSDLSSSFVNLPNDSRGDHFLVSSYQRFIEIEEQFLRSQPNCEIRLNTPVTLIEKLGQDSPRTIMKVTSQSDSKPAITFLADYVVVTASIACLKKELIKFSPDLSLQKRESIKNIGLAPYELVAFGFTEAFWKNDSNVNSDWLLFSACQETGNFPLAFLNFHKNFGKNILVGHFHGKFGQIMSEYSDQQLKEMVEKVLQRAFPKSKVSVKWIRRSEWQRTKYVGTGFSALHLKGSPYDFDRLAAPEKTFDERLLFAGEATYKSDFGCLRAAFISGQREASRILKQVSNKSRL
eukprot:TRINITY_DN1284_c0_g1_i1.p1 TRINITY_DN1284_c0_g1~~TRINITY_DN1284_c0_g1_i1.p1  ORF type:complete len:494 (-),score=111.26 TRINITY_DN1284_c0_g1_i1:3-1484(-)